MAVKILLADDHEVVRQGLRTILKARPEWEIIGEAENGQQAIDAVRELRPDVVILDITMPVMSGLEATQAICNLHIGAHVLIFTMHDSRSLVKAVEAMLGGGSFFGPENGWTGEEAHNPKASNLFCRGAFM